MDIELFDAIKAKDLDKVKTLIENGVNLEARNEFDNTPLMYACLKEHSNIEIIKLLINSGANVNAKDKYGSTALFYSCYEIDITKLLIDNGADINIKNEDGDTALLNMFTNWNEEIEEEFEILKLLLDNGADVNIENDEGKTALFYAYFENNNINIEILKLLLDNGADVNVKDSCEKTALMNSCYEGNFEISKLLIDNGADVNARDEDGDTALMKSFSGSYHINDINKREEYVNIIKLLIDNGANVNAKNNDNDKFLDLFGDDYVKEKIKEYLKSKKNLEFLKNLKLPEEIVCFDEIGYCDVLVKDFVKSTDTILIKIGNNIKGYHRPSIIEYYNIKKSLYSKEKLYPGEAEKIKNKENMFFSAIDTGKNTFVLVPQTKEKFFS